MVGNLASWLRVLSRLPRYMEPRRACFAAAMTKQSVAVMQACIEACKEHVEHHGGKLPPDGDFAADIPPDVEPSLLLRLGAAAIESRTAFGERQGAHELRPGRGTQQDPFHCDPLRADLDGLSLHATVRIPAGCRERLEKLCRYLRARRSSIGASRCCPMVVSATDCSSGLATAQPTSSSTRSRSTNTSARSRCRRGLRGWRPRL